MKTFCNICLCGEHTALKMPQQQHPKNILMKQSAARPYNYDFISNRAVYRRMLQIDMPR